MCWKYITPCVILSLFIYCAATYQVLSLQGYDYPLWAHLMGMAMGIISTIFVPLYFLYSIIIAPGNKVSEVRAVSSFFGGLLILTFLCFL